METAVSYVSQIVQRSFLASEAIITEYLVKTSTQVLHRRLVFDGCHRPRNGRSESNFQSFIMLPQLLTDISKLSISGRREWGANLLLRPLWDSIRWNQQDRVNPRPCE
jgi:hypothetical protein